MGFYNFIYRQYVTKGYYLRYFYIDKLHSILLKTFGDRVVGYNYCGEKIHIPFSEMSPQYYNRFPNYDRQLGRIAEYIREKKNSLNVIDVGANIGDTALGIGNSAKFILVEGNKKFNELISYNLRNGFDYKLICAFAGSAADDNGKVYEFVEDNGTGHLVETDDGVGTTTIDSIVEDNSFAVDILKIDTDGFDFEVIRGSEKTLKKYKPVLYIEWAAYLLAEHEESPVCIFDKLYEWGYQRALVFDNYGDLVTVVNTNDTEALKVLSDYPKNCRQRIHYFDLCLVHCSDSKIRISDLIGVVET